MSHHEMPTPNWVKVESPRSWRPTVIGQEIIAYYGGKTIYDGIYGNYEAALLHVPNVGTFYVTGVRLIRLLDTTCPIRGALIRVVWKGYKQLDEEREMKDYDLYISHGPALPPGSIPDIAAQPGHTSPRNRGRTSSRGGR